jgi:hypothetical protein
MASHILRRIDDIEKAGMAGEEGKEEGGQG